MKPEIDLSKYMRMKTEGSSPDKVYVAAKKDFGSSFNYLWLNRQVFSLNLQAGCHAIEKGEERLSKG